MDEAEVGPSEVALERLAAAGAELVIAEGREVRNPQRVELVLEALELRGFALRGEVPGRNDELDGGVGVHATVDVLHAVDGFLNVAENREAENACRRVARRAQRRRHVDV